MRDVKKTSLRKPQDCRTRGGGNRRYFEKSSKGKAGRSPGGELLEEKNEKVHWGLYHNQEGPMQRKVLRRASRTTQGNRDYGIFPVQHLSKRMASTNGRWNCIEALTSE